MVGPESVEDQYKILDFMPVGAVVLDRHYRVLCWNRCLECWTDAKKNEMLGRDLRELAPKLREAQYESRFQVVFEGGPPAIFSPQMHQNLIPCWLPNGEPRLQHTIVTALRAGDSEEFCALLTLQDASETQRRLQDYNRMRMEALLEVEVRWRAETALRASESKLAALANASLDAIVMLDSSTQVAFWNPAAERMFGYTAEEALGRNLVDLIVPEPTVELMRSGFSKFAWTGKGALVGRSFESTAIRKDRTEFPLEISIGAVELGDQWWAVGTMRDITNRKQNEKRLVELATMDSLTRLANRSHFIEVSKRELQRAKRYGLKLSFLLMDVDHFKSFNDDYGHDVGDQALRHVGRVLREALREVDIAGRVGGEEFAVLLPETDEDGALRVAERVRRRFAAHPVRVGRRELPLTVSVGVASGVEDTFETLMKRADKALYHAKNLGRNRVERQSS
jgi:diguanylate cyclase (GGDEF)-like protein/PAS domain S-box-containing protein